MRLLSVGLSLCVAAVCLLWVAPAAAGTDPGGAVAVSEEQKAQIVALKKLLEEAQKLKLVGEEGKEEAGSAEGEAAAEKSSAAENEVPVTAATRPGCMYRGNELLWEKKPGSCVDHPPH